jgi:ATP/maltotriose-dependent transcriptional regulator MalT
VRPYRAVLDRLAFPQHPTPRDSAAPDQAVVLGEGVLRMLRALAAERTGCLLRLEDLHRADEDTLAVVEYLAGAAADAPVLVAVSVRPGAVADRLRAADGVRSLALRRLGPEDVAALAAACRAGRPLPEADARALAIRSEGLPFVVEEMLAAPERTVPRTLASPVGRRLAGAVGVSLGRDVRVQAA